MDMTRQAVTQHLQLLEDANLVAVVRHGREKMAKGVSNGWPKILSNLKTMLETGSAFPGSMK